MACSLKLSSEGMAGAVVPARNWCLAGGLGAAGWKALSNPVEQQQKTSFVM